MFTIYTTCRSTDVDNFGLIQFNTIKSWTLIKPRLQIIVLGNEKGVSNICKYLKVTHVPNIPCSKNGTPVLNHMIKIAEDRADNDHMLHVSSDVFVFQDVVRAFKVLKANFNEFSAICRKRTQGRVTKLNFESDWEQRVKLDADYAIATSGDFYLFTKGYWENMPPFLIGRCICDSWMFKIGKEKKTMIDLTNAIDIVDYSHSYPFIHTKKEISWNCALGKKIDYGLVSSRYTTNCATWEMTNDFKLRSRIRKDFIKYI